MRKAVLGVLVVFACCGGVALAASVPELKASVERNGNVRVRWSFDATATREATNVELERSADGKTFAPLTTVQRARKRAGWLDRVKGEGPYSYRARVVTDGDATAWSTVASTGKPTGGGGSQTDVGGCPAGSEAEALRLVNVERAKIGAAALHDNLLLDVAADVRSTTMALSGNLTHTGWVEAIRAAGFRGAALGENIAYGYSSAAAVVNGWMHSDGHRANILRSNYHESGIGCVKDARGRLWWTHDFGS
ncbi:MAG TPA: CAP domain-containing protein [Candidatus Binatia bacterium]|jgi:uncharacterized protein YkwD|nr:CAP domain-containing protein [Candidatus Binatia bacterium]